MELTDEAIAQRVLDGDREAFRTLVDRHARKVYRIAWRFTRSKEDSDDIVQETFLRAYDKLETLDLRTSFANWLYRIAANRARDVLRKERHPGRRRVDEEEFSLEAAPVEAAQERRLASLEIRSDLDRAMELLTGSERVAFVMRHYEGMSIDEIGDILGTRTNATKAAIFRAVRKLREAMTPPAEREPCT